MIRGSIIFALVTIDLCVLRSESTAQWVQTGGPLGGPVDCITASPNGTDIFAGTEGGVFRSTDGGTTWRASSKGLPGDWVMALTVAGPDLFAGTYLNGVFRSTDNGATWAQACEGMLTPQDHLGVNSFARFGDNLFAGTWGEGVFVSSNNGTNWAPVSSGLTDKTVWTLAVCEIGRAHV